MLFLKLGEVTWSLYGRDVQKSPLSMSVSFEDVDEW